MKEKKAKKTIQVRDLSPQKTSEAATAITAVRGHALAFGLHRQRGPEAGPTRCHGIFTLPV